MAVMFFKLFTLCLPFFCLFLTWASSTTTPPPPPPTAISTLRSSGHSLFASTLRAATASSSFNFTGTILAPPDFAFSFFAVKFNHHRHQPPPRPSTSLLLYHTIEQPLTWQDLHSRANGEELRTLYDGHCIFASKSTNGDLSFAGSRKSIAGVKIRHPDLYVDDHLTVHGVDGVLDLASASKCSVSNPTVVIKLQIDRTLLDFAARALRRNGFYVLATALTIKCSDLMNLNGVTVFAPSDKKLFSFSDGFRYDFSHHVVPNRLRFADIARLPPETVMETIDPNKTLLIGSVNGYVTINGAKLDSTEIYQNRWIVVISLSRPFDDGDDNSLIQGAGKDGVPSMAPIYSTTDLEDYGLAVPSVAPSFSGDSDDGGDNSQIQGAGSNGVLSTEPIYSTTRLEDYGIALASVARSFNGDSDDGGDNIQIQGAGGAGVPSTAPIYSTRESKDYVIAVPSVAPSFSGDSGDRGRDNSPIQGAGSDGVPSTRLIYSTTGLENYGIAIPSVAPSFAGDSGDGSDNSEIQGPGNNRVPSTAPIYSTTGLEDYGIAVPSMAPRFSGDSEVSSPNTELPAIKGFLAKVKAGVSPPAAFFSEESINAARSSSPAGSNAAGNSPAISRRRG